MSMTGRKYSEAGYTLIETLVAMTLLVSIVIPLIAVTGNFIVDTTTDRLRGALRIAQTEMNGVSTSGDFPNSTQSVQGGFLVDRKVEKHGPIVEVLIVVSHSTQPDKKLVSLQKAFIAYK